MVYASLSVIFAASSSRPLVHFVVTAIVSPISAVALASAPRRISNLTVLASPAVKASSNGEDWDTGLALGLGLAPLSSRNFTIGAAPGRRAAIIRGVRLSSDFAFTS